jgi:hypothetical protein
MIVMGRGGVRARRSAKTGLIVPALESTRTRSAGSNRTLVEATCAAASQVRKGLAYAVAWGPRAEADRQALQVRRFLG